MYEARDVFNSNNKHHSLITSATFVMSTYHTTRRKKNCDRKRKSRGKFQMQNTPPRFPPLAPASQQIEQIVNSFCADTSPSMFEESGCAAHCLWSTETQFRSNTVTRL